MGEVRSTEGVWGSALSGTRPSPINFSLQPVLDISLRLRQDLEKYEGSGLWHASSLGYCMRRQWLKRKGVAETNPPDLLSLRRFAVGRTTEWWTKLILEDGGVLQKTELSLRDPDGLQLSGRVDILIGGEIKEPRDHGWPEYATALREELIQIFGNPIPTTGVELKSMQSRAFWHAKKNREPAARHHHFLQTACYDLLWDAVGREEHGFDVSRWVVACISKDDLSIDEASPHKGHIDEARGRLNMLNDFWVTDQPPPCTCGLSWEKSYCPYIDKSQGICCWTAGNWEAA